MEVFHHEARVDSIVVAMALLGAGTSIASAQSLAGTCATHPAPWLQA